MDGKIDVESIDRWKDVWTEWKKKTRREGNGREGGKGGVCWCDGRS